MRHQFFLLFNLLLSYIIYFPGSYSPVNKYLKLFKNTGRGKWCLPSTRSHGKPASHQSAWFDAQLCSWFQLPTNEYSTAKAIGDGSSWVSVIHMGNLDRVPSSQHQPGPAPAVVCIWSVDQQIEALCLSASQINWTFFLRKFKNTGRKSPNEVLWAVIWVIIYYFISKTWAWITNRNLLSKTNIPRFLSPLSSQTRVTFEYKKLKERRKQLISILIQFPP